MNRAEYRRKQRQEEKGEARMWVTRKEIEKMVADELMRSCWNGKIGLPEKKRNLLEREVGE